MTFSLHMIISGIIIIVILGFVIGFAFKKIRYSFRSDEMARENYVVVWLLFSAVFPNAISLALPNLLNWYRIAVVYIVHRRRRLVEDVARVGGNTLPLMIRISENDFQETKQNQKKNNK